MEEYKTPWTLINDYISVTYVNSKETTYGQYRSVLFKLSKDVEKAGYDFIPSEFTRETIDFIIHDLWKNQAVSTKKWKIHLLERFLRYYDNPVIKSMGIQWAQDMRPNVDWLTESEFKRLRDCGKTPLEEIVINLELSMGLRSVEVCRLRMRDVHFDSADPYVEVRGKGIGEGKWRTVPFGYCTEDAVKHWLKERNTIISLMRASHPYWLPPDNFLIWTRYDGPKRVCNGYTERGHSLDRAVIEKIRTRLNLDFSNHTLRRTFGRMSYRSGVPIATISKCLGHEDIATTLKYIGVDLDDMNDGMRTLSDYMRNL